jgi:hypothetical protein
VQVMKDKRAEGRGRGENESNGRGRGVPLHSISVIVPNTSG